MDATYITTVPESHFTLSILITRLIYYHVNCDLKCNSKMSHYSILIKRCFHHESVKFTSEISSVIRMPRLNLIDMRSNLSKTPFYDILLLPIRRAHVPLSFVFENYR